MALKKSLADNLRIIEELSGSDDIVSSPLKVGNFAAMALWCDSMINRSQTWEQVFKPLYALKSKPFESSEKLVGRLCKDGGVLAEAGEVCCFDQFFELIMSGFAVVIVDGSAVAVSIAAQGFAFRAITESYTEENVRSSREGFAEPLHINMTLIRRRIKSSLLVFETMHVGSVSNTEIALVYLKDRVSEKLLCGIRKRLSEIDIELVLESGFIQPFLSGESRSLFAGTGHTERPDSLCGKLLEGRVGIIVDGTPFALIVPYLFTENFQSFDDYTNKPYYVSFMRILKYLAFFVSIFLPAAYVASVNFNPEIIPLKLLYNVATAEQNTPLPLMFEALFIHLVYEIVREAGLRLPRPVGHAVSLIGALVVGEAAVSAGILGSPMVMCVALTAISSFTIPLLYEPITILRFCFILIAGTLGPIGIALGFCAMLIGICSIKTYGIPYTAPISPYSSALLRDGLLRRGWRSLSRHTTLLTQLNGADRKKDGDNGRA